MLPYCTEQGTDVHPLYSMGQINNGASNTKCMWVGAFISCLYGLPAHCFTSVQETFLSVFAHMCICFPFSSPQHVALCSTSYLWFISFSSLLSYIKRTAPGFSAEANWADRSLLVWSTPESESAPTSPQTKTWFVLSGQNSSGGNASWNVDNAELLKASLNVWHKHFKNAVLIIL